MNHLARPADQPLMPEWYHVTTLSNFARGYDKYQRRYSKDHIPESTFPNQFFLLRREELSIGITKARRLLGKLRLEGDRLVVLKTCVPAACLRNDHASGVAQYIPQNYIDLDSVYFIEGVGEAPPLTEMQVEDVVAQSFEVMGHTLTAWTHLTPRTVSVLPVAMACQAACRFCFSKASVSSDFEGTVSDWGRIAEVLSAGKEAGAERAVITGGGEPTLVKHDHLVELVSACARRFNKVVLITNGHTYGRASEQARHAMLSALDAAGLSVLAISRHHFDDAVNARIMGLDTQTTQVTDTLQAHKAEFARMWPRLICVLQKGGVETVADIERYLTWSVAQGVHQINFKELYVSTSKESAFSDRAANEYSAQHQVSLKVVYDFVARHHWQKTDELPWGAPIFRGAWQGEEVEIAAYTEPSVYWERTHGIARSWNLMSDGTLLASLEDPQSVVTLR